MIADASPGRPIARPPTFADGQTFHLPQIFTRLPVKRHPCFDEIDQRATEWATRFIPFATDAARERFLEEAHCLWTCLLFANGSPERVQDICDLTLLLFATDDAYLDRNSAGRSLDDADQILAQAGPIIRGELPEREGPWTHPLRDVWSRFSVRMPPGQRRRVVDGIVALYRGAASEVGSRLDGQVPAFDDYMRLRRDSVGAKIYLVLAEYATEVDLTAETHANSDLRALHDVAADHLILTNDLFSFRKEHYGGDAVNAVSVLRRHCGLSLQEIVDRLCATIEAREREFIDRRRGLLDSSLGQQRDACETLDALGYLLSGNLRWSYLTPRYHGPGYRWDGSTSGEVTLHPDRTVFNGG